MSPRRSLSRLVERVAAIEASAGSLLALFVFTVVLRNLLESAQVGTVFPPAAFAFHFPIAYVFPMLGITAVMQAMSGYPAGKLLKLMVFAWTLTLLPPVLDVLMGTDSAIGYFPLSRTNVGSFLLGFFDPSVELPGTTAGIRIEAALGCVLAGFFSWAVARSRPVLRGVLTTLLLAPLFLVFFTWPNLVHLALGGLFPHTETAQEMYQWHAATAPDLTGSFHYTIFIVDLLPVTLLVGWFLRRILPRETGEAARRLAGRPWALLLPVAGAAAALTSMGGHLTFADATDVAGALLAGLLLAVAMRSRGTVGTVVRVLALAAAAAVGWPVLVLAALAMAAMGLPGPAQLREGLTGVLLLLVPAATAGLSWSPSALPAVLLAAAALALPPATLRAASAVAAVVVSFLLPTGGRTARAEHYEGLVDALNRNGMQDLALPAASRSAAGGGGMLDLARAELESGSLPRARWAWEAATREGELSGDALRAGVNLAFVQGRTGAMDSLVALGGDELAAESGLAGLLLGRAAQAGDTATVGRLLSEVGPDPRLLHAYSVALSELGELQEAADWAVAAASHPEAGPAHLSWAIGLAGEAGLDPDSVYAEGAERFPGSVQLMTARLMASVTTGAPDRPDLLEAVLALEPASPRVLRAGAAWLLSAGMPDSALALAERAVASTPEPDPALLLLLCESASAAGDSAALESATRYAATLYPRLFGGGQAGEGEAGGSGE